MPGETHRCMLSVHELLTRSSDEIVSRHAVLLIVFRHVLEREKFLGRAGGRRRGKEEVRTVRTVG